MDFTAKLRYLQTGPQKVRLVADQIRGKDVEEASIILQHSKKRAALAVNKLLKSAVANAEDRDETIDIDDLFVKEISVDGGPTLKRVWFTTMGRAFRKVKRQSHVTIKLSSRPEGSTNGGKG